MLCTLRRSQVSPGRQMLTHCAGAVTDAKSIQIGHQRFSVMLSVAAAADVLLLLHYCHQGLSGGRTRDPSCKCKDPDTDTTHFLLKTIN